MTFELFELAESMQRQNIRRRHPEMTDRQVEERLGQWLARSPEEELGEEDLKHFRIRESLD